MTYDREHWEREHERLRVEHEQRLELLRAKARNQDRWWRRRFTTLCAVAICLTVVVAAGAFPWGGQEWTPNEGVKFLKWQREHGSSGVRFARNHPELAATFNGNWPDDHRARLFASKLRKCASSACSVDVIRYVFPDATEGRAIEIALCESGMDPFAVGDGGFSRGLFQVNYVHWRAYGGWVDQDRLFEPWYAAHVAHRLSDGGTNWSAWTCNRLT